MNKSENKTVSKLIPYPLEKKGFDDIALEGGHEYGKFYFGFLVDD